MNDALKFLAAFMTSPRAIGAVAPSGRALARQMLADLGDLTGHSLLEFGPGTGPFTRVIAEMIQPGVDYLGLDTNAQFIDMLSDRFPDMRFVCASAADAPTLLRDFNMPPVKAILCGLPFASLPYPVQDAVVDALDKLMQPGCQFRTFQYVHAYPLPSACRYRRRMTELFGPCRRSSAILANLPPAYVLSWSR